MKKPIYFISDVHFYLDDNETERVKFEKVSKLFDEIIAKQASLFIVGDFFDFWYEYKTVVSRRYFKILCKLRQLATSGCEVHYIGGNHDFWLYDFMKNDVGLILHYEPVEIEIDDKKFYIAHGDGIDPEDKGYLFLKKILRNAFFIKLFSFIPPAIAFGVAKFVSGTSRKYDKNTSEIIQKNREKLKRYASEKFKLGFDYVVLGHYHLPEEYYEGEKTYLNCGDWLNNFTYGKYDKNGLKLKNFNEENFKNNKFIK